MVKSWVVGIFKVFNPPLKLIVKAGTVGFLSKVAGEEMNCAIEVYLVLNFFLFHGWGIIITAAKSATVMTNVFHGSRVGRLAQRNSPTETGGAISLG